MLQTEAAECGLACLAMVAAYHGHDVDLAGLRRRFSTSLKGTNLPQIMGIAGQLGFSMRPLKLELAELAQLKPASVLHWDLNHFVVLKSVTARRVVIHDPARGVRSLSFNEASHHFTGVALELSPSPEFKPVSARRHVTLRALTGKFHGIVPALLQVLALAVVLELFSLVSPFFMQWVIDQVLVSADRDLLTLLGIGFLGVTVLQAAFTAARSWTLTWLGATVSVQWQANLVRHLLKLPLDWFQKRHVGDVVSRLGSAQTIQKTLTTQFIGSLLDGVMAITTLVVMGFYSVPLTLWVAGVFTLYGLLRWVFFRPFRRATEDQIVYAARQQSELLESIRGVLPVKLANQQGERSARYANATVETTNRDVGVQRLTIAFSAGNQLIFGVGRVALVWIAALQALDGNLSAGMMIAFVSFADQFTSRSGGLIDKWVDFKMLGLHAERLADVALAGPEPEDASTWAGSIPDSSIELRNVSFRYADGEPWVLKDCNLRIESGECVAITGPSGCGKTTLVKIVLGLLEPTEGEVLFGGVPLQKIGVRRFRSMVGAVMQEDQLFAGSLADNIAFFQAGQSDERIEAAARMAAIHDEVSRMPMGYQTLVGDMGSSLSGGQKQRVILARALYREPRLLLLDEATSHLDVERERLITQAVRGLDITRVIIAHRQESVSSADREISLAAHSQASRPRMGR
ncbi:peptidase domain-containing ABC transporter [Frateuria sp. GZRe12]|uniref:peptidase domain-containing ABC transporter n=1 Tax=Frateuria sp. GZRe12 TaxID=3351533 RepID=UPI003EDC69A5